MNREKTLELFRHLQAEPLRLHMGDWLIEGLNPAEDPRNPPCGTVHCAAGALVHIEANKRGLTVLDLLNTENKSIPNLAMDLLEITPEQEEVLFYVGAWPEPERTMYRMLAEQVYLTNHPHIIAAFKKMQVEVLIHRFNRMLMSTGQPAISIHQTTEDEITTITEDEEIPF